MTIEKIYAGFLGKNIAVRLGAPVEPINWTYDRIASVFGEITDYLKAVDRFAADDDINGPVFFIRSILDEPAPQINTAAIGRSWLNYAREGIGMFWWGGEGVSTEHTAYANLSRGIEAPVSGSKQQNGLTMAEQIGGQIFIDTWGLLFPGDPQRAADAAEMAASVSHDKNGLYGARFMAACIAEAFFNNDIMSVIKVGLSQVPEESTYYAVAQAVLDFHAKNPDDFRACRDYLTAEWGYDRYPGVCHIIPNTAVCVLALAYGGGDFSRTIEIATMCGWDTDCNAGNVGTILGVMNGLDGIPNKYRQPINDTTLASSAFGYLNQIDLPSFAQEIALYKNYLDGDVSRIGVLDNIKSIKYHFDLPGSTHGFRKNISNQLILSHGAGAGVYGSNALHVLVDNLNQRDEAAIFIKTNYHPEDLEDERYSPVFSPRVYSGQQVQARVKYVGWEGQPVRLQAYVRSRGEVIFVEMFELVQDDWQDCAFRLPEVASACIDEVGFFVQSVDNFTDGNGTLGHLWIDSFEVDGGFAYALHADGLAEEFSSLAPFSHHRSVGRLDAGDMVFESADSVGVSLTGHYYTADLELALDVREWKGESFNLIFRAKGLADYYAVRFDGGSVSVLEARTGRVLYTQAFEVPVAGQFKVEVVGASVKAWIDDELALTFDNLPLEYGAYGIGQTAGFVRMRSMKVIGELV